MKSLAKGKDTVDTRDEVLPRPRTFPKNTATSNQKPGS